MTSALDEFQLPEGWREIPFRGVARKVSESGFPDLESLSVFLDAGVVPRSSRDDNHNELGESLDKYQRVLPNDLVFNKLRTWQGGFGISDFEGIVSPAYIITRPDLLSIEPRFLGYLLKSKPYLAELTRLSKWMPPTQFDISWESIRELKLRIPQLKVQSRIADFLDIQISFINKTIELKQMQINLLKEESKGLTLSWLENAGKSSSENWESVVGNRAIRAKYIFEQINISGVDAPLASATMDGVFLRDELANDVWNPEESSDTYKLVQPGDFVMGLRSFQHGFSYSEILGKVSPAYSVFRLREEFRTNYNPKYFSYLFQTRQFISLLESISVGIRQGRNIPYESFGNLLIPIPSMDVLAKIHDLQERNLRKITLLSKSLVPLESLKTALITAAITGTLQELQEKEIV